jgi:hypothetical protein
MKKTKSKKLKQHNKTKKIKETKNKVNLNLKKVIELYKKEFDKLSKLSNEKFKKEQNKVNDLPKIPEEELLTNAIHQIVDTKNTKASIEEIKKLAKEFNPKQKKIHQCLEGITNIKKLTLEENEWKMSTNYSGIKKGKKVFIKVIKLKNVSNWRYKKIKNDLELTMKANKLDVVVKINDVFVCKDNDHEYKLFIIKDFIESESLTKYTKKKKLTKKQKADLKKLIDKCFANQILLEWLSSDKILVVKKGESLKFLFSSLKNASHFKTILAEKKHSAYADLEWLTLMSDNKIKDLCIKKLLREKIVTYNM